MDPVLIKTNILAIAASGLSMLLLGVGIYLFRTTAAPYLRFLLPIPPLGVAAYVYVFNLFRHFDGRSPQPVFRLIQDLTVATVTAASIFLLFSLCLTLVIALINHQ